MPKHKLIIERENNKKKIFYLQLKQKHVDVHYSQQYLKYSKVQERYRVLPIYLLVYQQQVKDFQ
jgi:hypothetical protein